MNLEGINAINKAINELGGCYPPQPITNTLLDLLNSSYPTQPHSLIIAKYYYWSLSEQGFTLLASQEGVLITKQLTLKNSGEHCTSFCRISFSFSSVILLSMEKSFSNGKKRKIEVPWNKECIHKVIQPFISCNIIFWHASYSTYSSLLTFLNNSNRTTHYKKIICIIIWLLLVH